MLSSRLPTFASGPTLTPTPTPTFRQLLALAAGLSLGAAIALGITRFAYGLLLPTMWLELGWDYTMAGAMNTFNALGYLLGALATPWLLKRFTSVRLLVAGSLLASVFMASTGFFADAPSLLIQRLLAGVASASVFIAGGVLAARLGALAPAHMGLLLGVYYGGTGIGIVLSALLVPVVQQVATASSYRWQWAWWALAAACLVATVVLAGVGQRLRELTAPPVSGGGSTAARAERLFRWRDFSAGLAGYFLFGTGYIGYMTFVVALLTQQLAGRGFITLFYTLLGVCVMASSGIWAGLLNRFKGGQALAILNALLGCATLLPALTNAWPLVLLSGVLFGGVFLSVVASTTALVRHNLPQSQWAAGISAFTVVFAAGQIVGPAVVGWIADSESAGQHFEGLQRGLMFSAASLWLGAWVATRQKSLNPQR